MIVTRVHHTAQQYSMYYCLHAQLYSTFSGIYVLYTEVDCPVYEDIFFPCTIEFCVLLPTLSYQGPSQQK